ncbi:hypothetical protein PT7_0281 [Pusillimonas sp. T7-7]|nr:hypothetical protein PT7_0281 [Pusillimonas sp. T7-7]
MPTAMWKTWLKGELNIISNKNDNAMTPATPQLRVPSRMAQQHKHRRVVS